MVQTGRASNTDQTSPNSPFTDHPAPINSSLAYKFFRAKTKVSDATRDLLNAARLPEIPNSTEYNTTPAAIAEFCHNQWQIHKDPKPRWVAFWDSDGKPITDIRSYLKERNIPPEYWAEHARRPNGDFLARVDRIPYEYLPRSFQEERQREAQISIKAIGWIAGAKSEADAKERIFTVLSHEHRNYRAQQLDNRLKSDQFGDLPVSDQYSATTILNTIAKKLGVSDQNEFVGSAFDHIRKDLYNQIVELAQRSDQQGTIVDAYRRIIRQYGSHPYDFLRHHKDAYGALFNKIESKVAIDIGLPDLNQLEPGGDIPQNLKNFLGLDTEHTFKLKRPPTESSQGASILIVTDSEDHPVKVLRIDTGWRAVQEYLSERIIAENEKIGHFFTSPHQIIAITDPSNGVDAHNKQKFLTVSNYAGGKSLDERFLANEEHDNEIPAEIGQRLAAFHSATVRQQSPDAILDPSKTIKSIRYDLDGIRRRGITLANRSQTPNLPSSTNDNVSRIATSYQRLEPLIISLAERFENTAFFNPTSFEKATAHGDMHPGNMFDTFIDNNTLVYSLGRQAPITSPAVDVGRCIGYLIVEGTRLNKSFEDIMADISQLREAYRDARNQANKPILDESIHSMAEDFYALVYVAQNCVDVDQVKLKPLNSIESQTELILRLHANVNSYVTRDDAALREQSGNGNRPDELLESTKSSPFFRRLWTETESSWAKR